MTAETTPRPRTGRIPDAIRYSGIARSTLYNLAAKYVGLFLKLNTGTLVDFNRLDEIIDKLPPAKLRARKEINHDL